MTEHVGGRTPSHIKWLLNERAMLQGKFQRLTDRLHAHRMQIEAAQAALTSARKKLSNAQLAHGEVLQKIRALTIAIDSMAPEVSPDAVGPVNAWAGKYGQRGALTAFLKELLQDAYPKSLTIQEVCLAVQLKFGLATSTSFERGSLVYSIRARLRECRARGLVSSLHVPHKGTRASVWRWQGEPSTFEMLRQQEAQRDEDASD